MFSQLTIPEATSLQSAIWRAFHKVGNSLMDSVFIRIELNSIYHDLWLITRDGDPYLY